MYLFYQMMIVHRNLTNNPELPAARELLELTRGMTQTSKEQFCWDLDRWHDRWRDFLKERTQNGGAQRIRYKHQRLRNAYLSIRCNMPWIWNTKTIDNYTYRTQTMHRKASLPTS